MKKILIVEDQLQFVRLLKRYLEQSGYQVYIALQGKEALEIIAQHHVDLILLDLMLPDTNGLCICEEIRTQYSSIPIVIISQLIDTENKVHALRSCAEDYITKPFDMAEVLERVNVQFRRIQQMYPGADKQNFTAGPLSIHFEQRRVIINEQEIHLTYKEYELLSILAINYGKIVTYDFLQSKVWDDESDNRSIHTYVNHLRKKIEVPAQCRFIHNEPRVGYRFKHVNHQAQ
jgi:DNA-binding response OmpR family regulator